ncbi:MAG: lysoplasmalogenase [Acidimicrobiia bacterium]|nr:lysoplasmalogenase [Acidimicrobiia bacterium]
MLIAGVGVCVVGLIALLWAERHSHPMRVVAKPVASLGFLVVTFASGWPVGAAAAWLAIGLILSAIGDVVLLGEGKRWFLTGLVAFAFAHIALLTGFVVRAGTFGSASGVALVLATAIALLVARWLMPNVDGEMRVPVQIYMVLITAMVVASVAAVTAGATIRVSVGSVMFWLSDVAVARQQFVAPAFANKLAGLPLYYGGVLLLAWTVAAGQI